MRIADRLFVLLQRILPKRAIGALVYRVSRSRIRPLKAALIRGFCALYRVDISEADPPDAGAYASFNEFFTRPLRPGVREFDDDPSALLSPADGTLQNAGPIRGDQLLQVKGITYDLSSLLGGDRTLAGEFLDGAFATIYLAPYNYHRVHMPLAGTVTEMRHVPGALLSVNRATAELVPGLFAGNERLVLVCENGGLKFCVILVGALNVGSMSVAWSGEVLPARRGGSASRDYRGDPRAPALARGEYLGHFNLGSTVILLFPAGRAVWRDGLAPGQALRVGESIGRRGGDDA